MQQVNRYLKEFKHEVKMHLCITFGGLRTRLGISAVELLGDSLVKTLERIDKAQSFRQAYNEGVRLFGKARISGFKFNSDTAVSYETAYRGACEFLLSGYEVYTTKELFK